MGKEEGNAQPVDPRDCQLVPWVLQRGKGVGSAEER